MAFFWLILIHHKSVIKIFIISAQNLVMKESPHMDLEIHPTKDINDGHINGSLTVIWRDYDGSISEEIKMIYVSSVEPGEIKGPHLHTKRNSYFICIHGKVVFIHRDENGKYYEIEASAEIPKMIKIPRGIASAHVNISNQTSKILALADISWKPNDNEMENVVFTEYDWKKWFSSKKL